MTADRERILELLREVMEERPDVCVGRLVEAAANKGKGVSLFIEDRDLLYGLLDMRKVKP